MGGRPRVKDKAAGDSWHAIVGRAIYDAVDVTQAAKETTRGVLCEYLTVKARVYKWILIGVS